jgi:hypothetical protein
LAAVFAGIAGGDRAFVELVFTSAGTGRVALASGAGETLDRGSGVAAVFALVGVGHGDERVCESQYRVGRDNMRRSAEKVRGTTYSVAGQEHNEGDIAPITYV